VRDAMRCRDKPESWTARSIRSACRVLSEATVVDAIRCTRCRQALQAGWCKNLLGQCCWSDAKKLVRSRIQSHDLFA